MKSKVWWFACGVAMWLPGSSPLVAQPESYELTPVGLINSQTRDWSSMALHGHYVLLQGQSVVRDTDGGWWTPSNTTYLLDVVDIGASASPTLVSSLEVNAAVGWYFCGMAVGANHAFMLYGHSGGGCLRIVDLENPRVPRLETSRVFGAAVSGLNWSRGYLYVLVGGQLLVFDAQNPLEVIQVGAVSPVDPKMGWNVVATYGDNAYVVGGSGSSWDDYKLYLQLIDIRNPAQPNVTGSVIVPRLGDVVSSLSLTDGYAYVGYNGIFSCYGGVVIIDVSAPSQLKVASECRTRRCIRGLSVAGDHMLWAGHEDLRLFDIADPSQPVCVASGVKNYDSSAEDAVIDGGRAYVLKGSALLVLDIVELPAITHQSIQNGKLILQWNEPARGMKLQRSTTLENPDWQTLQGSELTTSAELPLWGGPEYFRLGFEGPENMVWIPPGTFMMGSPEDEQDRSTDEGPQTEVTLTQGCFMGKYEVTQGEYLDVMGNNPSYFNGVQGETDYGTDLNRPVEQVSWDNAVAYCAALTERERAAGRIPTSYSYRFPTEAEWEYACRAGTTTRFSYGDDPDYAELTNYAWYYPNSLGMRQPVGQKLPNPWGLHDMHGNVFEWCQDWWGDYPGGIALDPQGPATGSDRVIRGGFWVKWDDARFCRSAFRNFGRPDGGDGHLGFRAVLAPGQP